MSFHSVPAPQTLDVLCPMHVVVGSTGHIVHCGPTAVKLLHGQPLIGQRFLEVFRVTRPREVQNMRDLTSIIGAKLHIEIRGNARTDLKGVALVHGDNGEILVNLSFGISVLEAVREYSLSSRDFPPTSLAIEMLYLVEAKSAAMEALGKLTKRLQGAKRTAEEQAFTDALTGLNNRRAFDISLAKLVSNHVPFSLMHVDLDYFKAVNDTLGHAAGDLVLENVAEVFRGLVREEDTVARVGGDEFVIVLPGVGDRESLEALGKRIIEGLEKPVMYKNEPCKISGSIGTVIWDAVRPTSPESLIDDADIALYASKNAGRARQTFYEPLLRETTQSEDDSSDRPVELWD